MSQNYYGKENHKTRQFILMIENNYDLARKLRQHLINIPGRLVSVSFFLQEGGLTVSEKAYLYERIEGVQLLRVARWMKDMREELVREVHYQLDKHLGHDHIWGMRLKSAMLDDQFGPEDAIALSRWTTGPLGYYVLPRFITGAPRSAILQRMSFMFDQCVANDAFGQAAYWLIQIHKRCITIQEGFVNDINAE